MKVGTEADILPNEKSVFNGAKRRTSCISDCEMAFYVARCSTVSTLSLLKIQCALSFCDISPYLNAPHIRLAQQ